LIAEDRLLLLSLLSKLYLKSNFGKSVKFDNKLKLWGFESKSVYSAFFKTLGTI
jgi:hypothetical protein